MILRLVVADDAEPIAALFSASRLLLTFPPELHGVDDDRAHIRDDVLANQRVAVAGRHRRIVGFLAETLDWINYFYMAPDQLRSGVGSALTAVVKAWTRSLELRCFARHAPARASYEKHGFVAVEFTDGQDNEAGMPTCVDYFGCFGSILEKH